jgi:hypothetical protein
MTMVWKYGAAGLLAAALAGPAFAQNVPISPNPTTGNTAQSATGTTVTSPGCTRTAAGGGNTTQSAQGTRVAGTDSTTGSGTTSQAATGITVTPLPCK